MQIHCLHHEVILSPDVSAAVVKPGVEQVDHRFDTIQIDGSFAPGYLRGISCGEYPQNKGILELCPEFSG
ncbi:MAG: hypothetical protein IKB80_00185 [Oscillospiraceae bacterium]|nr:hypothetical protein [Oscillospiraceae bacterium]